MPKERSYDRPGKKPAAPFQYDPLKLEEYCRWAGGSAFAFDWIISTFKGVDRKALLRSLRERRDELPRVVWWFEPTKGTQGYDGFISKKVGKRHERSLCREGNRARWENKKDPHGISANFHFGLADVRKAW